MKKSKRSGDVVFHFEGKPTTYGSLLILLMVILSFLSISFYYMYLDSEKFGFLYYCTVFGILAILSLVVRVIILRPNSITISSTQIQFIQSHTKRIVLPWNEIVSILGFYELVPFVRWGTKYGIRINTASITIEITDIHFNRMDLRTIMTQLEIEARKREIHIYRPFVFGPPP